MRVLIFPICPAADGRLPDLVAKLVPDEQKSVADAAARP